MIKFVMPRLLWEISTDIPDIVNILLDPSVTFSMVIASPFESFESFLNSASGLSREI